jgi:hypothetical protein
LVVTHPAIVGHSMEIFSCRISAFHGRYEGDQRCAFEVRINGKDVEGCNYRIETKVLTAAGLRFSSFGYKGA